MPSKNSANSRQALGRDPFADLESLNFFDDDLFGDIESRESTASDTETEPVLEEQVASEPLQEANAAAQVEDLPAAEIILEPGGEHSKAEMAAATTTGITRESTVDDLAEANLAELPENLDSSTPLDYDSYLAQHPELFESTIAGSDIEELTSDIEAESIKPSKTQILGAMGIDFATLEEETGDLLESDRDESAPTNDQEPDIVGELFKSLEEDTAELDESHLTYAEAKPSKTQMLDVMGIDFETLEDETTTLEDEITEELDNKPSKTQMLNAMGIDFGTLEEETGGLEDSDLTFEEALPADIDHDGIDLVALQTESDPEADIDDEAAIRLADFGIDLEALQDETEELEAAFAAQAAFEAAMWAGMGLASADDDMAESFGSEAPDETRAGLHQLLDLDVHEAGEDTNIVEAVHSAPELADDTEAPLDVSEDLTDSKLKNSVSMSLPAVVSAIDDEMRLGLTELLKGLQKSAEVEARAANESAPQYLVFLLDDLSMAIPVANITEISQPLPITKVPNLPNWLLGVSNLRGDIVSVIDMRLYFLGQRQVIRPDSRFLVVHDSQNNVSTTLIVDQIAEFQHLITDQIEKNTPANINKHVAPFVTGTYQLFERQIVMLDLDSLLSSTAFRQFEPI